MALLKEEKGIEAILPSTEAVRRYKLHPDRIGCSRCAGRASGFDSATAAQLEGLCEIASRNAADLLHDTFPDRRSDGIWEISGRYPYSI